MRTAKILRVSLAVAIILSLLCSCSKPLVGKKVSRFSPSRCRFHGLPAECNTQDNVFNWDFSIQKGKKSNEYILKATADPSGGYLKHWTNLDRQASNFYLLLVNNTTIIDSFGINPMSMEFQKGLRFYKEFTCEQGFDAAMIYWSVSVYD